MVGNFLIATYPLVEKLRVGLVAFLEGGVAIRTPVGLDLDRRAKIGNPDPLESLLTRAT